MSEKKKLAADGRFIEKLLGVVPLDWARRENDDLVYLNQAGQKFTITDAELTRLISASAPAGKPAQKAAAAAAEPPASPPAKPAGAAVGQKPAVKKAASRKPSGSSAKK